MLFFFFKVIRYTLRNRITQGCETTAQHKPHHRVWKSVYFYHQGLYPQHWGQKWINLLVRLFSSSSFFFSLFFFFKTIKRFNKNKPESRLTSEWNGFRWTRKSSHVPLMVQINTWDEAYCIDRMWLKHTHLHALSTLTTSHNIETTSLLLSTSLLQCECIYDVVVLQRLSLLVCSSE